MLNKEFLNYIDNDLSRPFIEGDSLYDKEKLASLLFAILRIKNSAFVDLFKEEINIYLKSTIKQTVIEYVAQLDDDYNEDNHVRFVHAPFNRLSFLSIANCVSNNFTQFW